MLLSDKTMNYFGPSSADFLDIQSMAGIYAGRYVNQIESARILDPEIIPLW